MFGTPDTHRPPVIGRVLPLARLDAPAQPLSVHSHHPGETGRERAEHFVHGVYRRAYDARIRTFYPHLVCVTEPRGALVAVAGIRAAGNAALYAEQYLACPVEQVLSERLGTCVLRNEVVEVGNLAPASAGQTRWLIAVLTGYLQAAGFAHVVFTAVPALYNAFRRLGLPLAPIADADPALLHADAADHWGSYYRDSPRVCTGSVQTGHELLMERVRGSAGPLSAVWHAARGLGVVDRERLLATAPMRETA